MGYGTPSIERSAAFSFVVSLSDLSARIGRNAAYVQQYLERGTPRRLPENERRHLAIVLEIDERELGARDPWRPAT